MITFKADVAGIPVHIVALIKACMHRNLVIDDAISARQHLR